jgi:hypothetical protein
MSQPANFLRNSTKPTMLQERLLATLTLERAMAGTKF